MNEMCRWTAIETAAQLRAGKVSVREVVSAHLARAHAVNPRLNALPAILDEEALARADELDAGGDRSALLFGLPVTIKINIDQKGTVNSNGIPALAGNVANEDSPLVTNMRRDGAVFIARTNTPEFSLRWFTSNPLHGVTKNPWDETLTPGGSSGGASSSVAAGVGVIAHGNDLGGSLRYPAYCCGIASIRPSLGRVPAFNPSLKGARPPITQQMSVQGPIARSVGDLRLALRSMASRDSRDPLWCAAQSSGRMRDKVSLRIGMVVNAFDRNDDPEVIRAVEIASQGLKAAGHCIEPCTPPQMQHAAKVWGQLLSTETELLSLPFMREVGSPQLNRSFEGYKAVYGVTDLAGYMFAMQERLRLQWEWARFFDDYDLLLMPASGALPFENDLDFKHPDAIPDMLKAQEYLFVVNVLGLPAVAVPTHVAQRAPCGVQLVAPMHDDWFCLDVAEALEREIGRPVEGLAFG